MYRLTDSGSLIRLLDGAIIPFDECNRDYLEYAGWLAAGNTPHPPDAPTLGDIITALTAALERHYDAKARERRYDTRYTCALRAGYSGPFQAEGRAFATWMDDCNALAYQIMADVEGGNRQIPSADELIAEMPEMVWPA